VYGWSGQSDIRRCFQPTTFEALPGLYVDLLERRPLPRRRWWCEFSAKTALRLQQTTTTKNVVVRVMKTKMVEMMTTVVSDCARSLVRTMSTRRLSEYEGSLKVHG